MEKFPFYGLEPKERLAKLKEHFLKFEEDSTKRTVQNELNRQKDELVEAASTKFEGHDVLIKSGEDLLIEVETKRIKEMLTHIKDVY
ncbi:carbamoyltransferase, putative [Babesia ovata]|uniref:Carbamoyltransferase, putative n=1 Tax=Babesia ovata TaxID=189622 RepID=A0A2H6K7A1_9APIC|nr:carbamoyltransferase, putative [Babesia ovata]GBE58829.1 carbamoyltransferase, putative [Babesia ovata]